MGGGGGTPSAKKNIKIFIWTLQSIDSEKKQKNYINENLFCHTYLSVIIDHYKASPEPGDGWEKDCKFRRTDRRGSNIQFWEKIPVTQGFD